MEKAKGNGGVRKRTPNACSRCRKQKIKCTGSLPCDQCNKRNLVCDFDDGSQKVLVTKGFISGLQKKLASLEQSHNRRGSIDESIIEDDHDVTFEDAVAVPTILQPSDSQPPPDDVAESSDHGVIELSDQRNVHESRLARSGTHPNSSRTSPGPHLVNPLALGYSAYVSDVTGKPFYLGTSSNWALCRRVLAITHERVFHEPPAAETLLYEGNVYDLGWGDQSSLINIPDINPGTLPSVDFALYLVDAVKFHCGQFHLFDEDSFIADFERFHDPKIDKSTIPQIWYIHYILILAFGKAFVVRINKGGRPPGAELFVQAMKLLPDATVLCPDPVHAVEVLCCAALYSQSLDFRSLAYQLVGQALRMALANGMHTSMQSSHVDQRYVERCRKAWWTTYLLDRQMSSLMGVPMAIRDEDISAGLPTLTDPPQKVKALDLHVKLSRVIAQIFNTIYGAEVNLDKRFVLNVKTALKSIAQVTYELNDAFPISTNGSMAGVTRLSAYLHLLQHHCILLATRPLLFTFLEMRLNSADLTRGPVPRRGSVRALLQMCVESAQQTLKMLSGLQEQSLLESFLPFDLDPTFTSALVLLMAVAVDARLLEDCSPWMQLSFTLLDEMIFRGNLIAAFLKSELEQLGLIIKHLPPIARYGGRNAEGDLSGQQSQPGLSVPPNQNALASGDITVPQPMVDYPSMSDDFSVPDVDWHDGVNTEHLIMVADALDLEGFNWLASSFNEVQPPH